jgi:hypothetical protein
VSRVKNCLDTTRGAVKGLTFLAISQIKTFWNLILLSMPSDASHQGVSMKNNSIFSNPKIDEVMGSCSQSWDSTLGSGWPF